MAEGRPRVKAAGEWGAEVVSSILRESWRAVLMRSIGLRWYGRKRFLEELSLIPSLLLSRRAVIHHLYAEESYRFGGYVPRLRGSALVGTFHMPPSEFHRYVAYPGHLRRLDAIIAVSRDQAAFLRSFAAEDRVFHVPRGVDSDFFQPAELPPEEFRCLFVGFWLRQRALD